MSTVLDCHIDIPLEVAVFSGESILKAQSQGASRAELSAPGSYEIGGTTPPVSELAKVADKIKIPIRIMIRPRGPIADGSQDFMYSLDEVEEMAQSIREFKAAQGLMKPIRGDGFVFGLLRPSTSAASMTAVDERNCRYLVNLARPFACVFHRAFDPIAATSRAAEDVQTLVDLGFDGLLTAGGSGTCLDNIDNITHLCQRIAGRIEIVVGGGLRRDNIAKAAGKFPAPNESRVWMHTSALSKRPDHQPEEIDEDELASMATRLGRK